MDTADGVSDREMILREVESAIRKLEFWQWVPQRQGITTNAEIRFVRLDHLIDALDKLETRETA